MPPYSVPNRPVALAFALVGLVTVTPAASRADAPAATSPSAVLPSPQATPPADLESRVRDLEETVRQLQETIRQLRESQPPGQPAVQPADVQKMVDERLKQQKSPVSWQDGFTLQSPDGNFLLKVHGYLQSDSRWFPSNKGDTGANSFYLRRVRPIFEGTVYKNMDFRLMPDFGLGTTVLQDAYLDLRLSPEFQIRAGKYKEPVSLERLQSGTDLLFAERSIANNLAPNRDVGAMFHGDLSQGTIGYALGVFNGVLDGGLSDGDVEDSKDVVARVFLQPFKNQAGSAAQGLGFGVAGSIGRQRDPLAALAYKTAGRSTFFKYDPAAVGAGDHRRLEPQLYYFQGPFGLMSEYARSQQGVRKGATRGDLTNTGWYVQGSYVLTGEKATYRSVTPAKPFDPKNGQWGAFELAARLSQIHVDQDAFRLGLADPTASASDAHAYTLGLNWYLNRAVKAQFNYERTVFDRSIKFGSDKRDHEDVFLTELQLAF
jgi:phosphate-selective porin OprO and OprP